METQRRLRRVGSGLGAGALGGPEATGAAAGATGQGVVGGGAAQAAGHSSHLAAGGISKGVAVKIGTVVAAGAVGCREPLLREVHPLPRARQRLEQVRGAAAAGVGAIAVLGHCTSGSRGNQRGGFYRFDAPPSERPMSGGGTVHHVAWATPMDEQDEWQRRVAAGGADVTPVIDRFWFRSIYFREPSGVLFEIATDGPGFTIDEPLATLGNALTLPPWVEGELGADGGKPQRQRFFHLLSRWPEATEADIQRLCEEAAQYKFASVCVNPSWVRAASCRACPSFRRSRCRAPAVGASISSAASSWPRRSP